MARRTSALFIVLIILAISGCRQNTTAPPPPAWHLPPTAQKTVVPNLEGMSEDQALKEVNVKNLRLNVTTRYDAKIMAGQISSQIPLHGTAVLQDTQVLVFVSLGPQPVNFTSSAGSIPPPPDLSNLKPPQYNTTPGVTGDVQPPSGPNDGFLVCIDPGHPSETSDGATVRGLSENQLNWQVAQRLVKRLEIMGIATQITKQRENEMVTNRQRTEIANKNRASLFIRIHCDEGSGQGYTWYYPDREGTKQGVTGPSPAVQEASRSAAYILNESMKPILKDYLQCNPIKTDRDTFVGGKQGGVLTGSIFSQVPIVLIEMCFINRSNDASFIASPEGQEKMAEALAEAIRSYKESQAASTEKR